MRNSREIYKVITGLYVTEENIIKKVNKYEK